MILRKAASKVKKRILMLQDILFVLRHSRFMKPATGREYSLGYFRKVKIVFRFAFNSFKIPGASDWKEHLLMATAILRTPKNKEGVVAECGCFHGFSSANLSTICRITGRTLCIFDSFEGLPEPKEGEGLTVMPHRDMHYDFQAGQYYSGMDVVKNNITKYGDIGVCEFFKGYFEESMPGFNRKAILVFEDADLRSSVETCLQYMWPLLQEDCSFYCHEPWAGQVVDLFYDKKWWRETHDCEPPGFVGSGLGVPLGPASGSGIGYATKINMENFMKRSKLKKGALDPRKSGDSSDSQNS